MSHQQQLSAPHHSGGGEEIRLQIDAGDPFRFLTVTSRNVTVRKLRDQVESDFAELYGNPKYGKQFQASLQVLRLQDSLHNDMPDHLLAGEVLKDNDKVFVVIKNLHLPPPNPEIPETNQRTYVSLQANNSNTTPPKFMLPSPTTASPAQDSKKRSLLDPALPPLVSPMKKRASSLGLESHASSSPPRSNPFHPMPAMMSGSVPGAVTARELSNNGIGGDHLYPQHRHCHYTSYPHSQSLSTAAAIASITASAPILPPSLSTLANYSAIAAVSTTTSAISSAPASASIPTTTGALTAAPTNTT
ncbi:hypothetical protein QOT17_009472 [Balamuthia mandrillaris]